MPEMFRWRKYEPGPLRRTVALGPSEMEVKLVPRPERIRQNAHSAFVLLRSVHPVMEVRMIRPIVALAALSFFGSGPAFAVGKPADVSWGKPNVAFASYNADAQQCAQRAFGVTVGMKPQTSEALGVLQGMSLYSFITSWNYAQHGGPMAAADAVRPDHVPFRSTDYEGMFKHAAWVDVVEQLQQVVDTCLTERGYHKFRLTDAQRDMLRRLKGGTAEREHYLHSLGSNPQVLAAQRI